MLRFAFLLVLLGVQQAGAVIYGTDDRRDIYQVPWLAEAARAVAVAVPNNFLEKAADGTWTVTDTQSLYDGGLVCRDERFSEQPSMGVCSGFLIGDRYLVTAGHCVLPNGVVDNQFHPFCEAFSWYFDYNLKAPGQFPVSGISADRVYGCKNVIRAETLQLPSGLAGHDFALIELDRPVSADIKPLTVSAKPVAVGDQVYTIGHPYGMPAKYSGLAPVLKLDTDYYFSANLDTEGGNSGGGVFNTRGEIVGILVSGYQLDTYTDAKLRCERFNVCDANGLNCRDTSDLQLSNFVQSIGTVMSFMPKPFTPLVGM